MRCLEGKRTRRVTLDNGGIRALRLTREPQGSEARGALFQEVASGLLAQGVELKGFEGVHFVKIMSRFKRALATITSAD